MTYTRDDLWRGLAFWLIVSLAALRVGSMAFGQATRQSLSDDPRQTVYQNVYTTRPWLASPHVSPYLLLDSRDPFDNDDAERYYLWVRPQLEYDASKQLLRAKKYPTQPTWTPYRSQSDYGPYGLRPEASRPSRYMNYGSYYQYQHPTVPPTGQKLGGVYEWNRSTQ